MVRQNAAMGPLQQALRGGAVGVEVEEDANVRSAIVTVDGVEDTEEDPIFGDSLPLRMCPNAIPTTISMAKCKMRTLILKARLRCFVTDCKGIYIFPIILSGSRQ